MRLSRDVIFLLGSDGTYRYRLSPSSGNIVYSICIENRDNGNMISVKDQKIKILRNEYSRWNALTNNTDKMIRERAKEMRDLAANLRSQYNK